MTVVTSRWAGSSGPLRALTQPSPSSTSRERPSGAAITAPSVMMSCRTRASASERTNGSHAPIPFSTSRCCMIRQSPPSWWTNS